MNTLILDLTTATDLTEAQLIDEIGNYEALIVRSQTQSMQSN